MEQRKKPNFSILMLRNWTFTVTSEKRPFLEESNNELKFPIKKLRYIFNLKPREKLNPSSLHSNQKLKWPILPIYATEDVSHF